MAIPQLNVEDLGLANGHQMAQLLLFMLFVRFRVSQLTSRPCKTSTLGFLILGGHGHKVGDFFAPVRVIPNCVSKEPKVRSSASAACAFFCFVERLGSSPHVV